MILLHAFGFPKDCLHRRNNGENGAALGGITTKIAQEFRIGAGFRALIYP